MIVTLDYRAIECQGCAAMSAHMRDGAYIVVWSARNQDGHITKLSRNVRIGIRN